MQDFKHLIFISGTGRSGTHLIGRALSSHQEIIGRIEIPSTFRLITRIATTQDITSPLLMLPFKSLLRIRLKRILSASAGHVLEKSHPSLWLADFLIKQFETSKFIFVYRDLEPTVSSMLEHKDVLSWYEILPQNRPNRFLGITASNASQFDEYALEKKCALRWLSHYNEIFRLKVSYPDRIYIVKYDEFLANPAVAMGGLSSFLGVPCANSAWPYAT